MHSQQDKPPHPIASEPDDEAGWFTALLGLARHLRGPEGCPWDKERTAAEFAAYVGEEAEELRQAFGGTDSAHMSEEWGDTFFVLLAALAAAEDEGLFDAETALKQAYAKMIRRHEHVFGGAKAASPEDAVARWNAIKAEEKGGGARSE